ncbi:hypothetical protein [Paraburkholderia caribensis]|uniref:hypothetical protein n=1 Tax=Paraburkholderia caribensis TaxID=75105 RepID=UPI0028541EBB|nr:hypothetical protein [Paraburkholderia caribensis]MDR6382147.1 hypothetical protein [Paraburkholderia caribensis]
MTDTYHALKDYYAALQRLREGRSEILPRGSAITNDAVSIEAGRAKGSIKKSRPVFAELIREIQQAALAIKDPVRESKTKLEKSKREAMHFRLAYEAALARELSLIKELYEAKKILANITNRQVIPLRGRPSEHEE